MKIFRAFSRISFLYKFLISFLGVALVPLVLVTVFFYRYNMDSFQSNVERLSRYQLVQIRNAFSRQFEDHVLIAQKLSAEPSLGPVRLGGEQYERYEALSSFRKYMLSSNFNEQPYLYVRKKDLIYGLSGINDLSTMAVNLCGFSDSEVLRKWLENIKTPSVKTFDTLTGMQVVFQYPLYQGQVALLFLMSYQDVMDMFHDMVADIDGIAIILDGSGEIIADNMDKDALRDSVARAVLETGWDGIYHTSLAGKAYTLITTRSSATGWMFAVAVPQSAFAYRSLSEASLIWQISVVAVILGVAASVFLTIMHYTPLKRVTGIVGGFPRIRNEYEQIRENYIDSVDENGRLQQKISFQAPYVRERLLELLLFSGSLPDNFMSVAKRENLGMNEPWFYALSLTLAGCHDADSRSCFSRGAESAASMQSSAVLGVYSLHRVERLGENNLILVVNLRDPQFASRINSGFLGTLVSLMKGLSSVKVVCGFGGIYQDIMKLRKSLYEANAALEYNLEHDRDPIFAYRDIPRNDESSAISSRLWAIYLQQLKYGDMGEAFQSLNKIFTAINREASFENERAHLVQYLKQEMIELGVGEAEDDIGPLASESDALVFESGLKQLTIRLCEAVGRQKKSGNIRLKDNILLFIKNNFHDPDLSLDENSRHFGLSPSYLSRFIREQTGLNIKDYISRIRIAEAKKLLVESELPVSEIVERIGYYNSSSFIRKFRNIEGATPGDYRQKNKKPIILEDIL